MNTLQGNIIQVESQEDLLLIKIKINDSITLSSIVIEESNSFMTYNMNKKIKAYFKETEVIISKDRNVNISIQNKIPCVVQSILKGKILSEITLAFDNRKIKSLITTNACNQLNLEVNDEVLVLIKTNEISLSNYD
jgi:molybdate transport system regulatory protein